MNTITITINGKPKAKKRARKGKYNNWYNPSEKDMAVVKNEIKKQLPDGFEIIEKNIPVSIHITCFFKPNKSQSTKLFINEITENLVPFCKKPDADNISKFYKDCMSKIVYYDDNQVYFECINKFYGNEEFTRITFEWEGKN